jgi:hypothetical protein
MIFRCIFCILSAVIVFSVLQVSAQTSSPAEGSTQARQRIVYREKSYFEFEDSLIRGDQPSPDGSSLFRKERVPFKSSLNLTRSFMPELRESAKDAR